jgi:sugar/nucleoside kinase (ribokinase family)
VALPSLLPGGYAVLEKEIEAHLVAGVKDAGGIAYKFTSPNRRSVPDRIVCYSGQAVFVELKAPGKHPTPAQLREHERLRNCGMQVEVIDTIGGVDAFIAGLVQRK